MKYLLIMLAATVSFAGNQDGSTLGNGNNVNNCNPVFKCNSRPHVVYRTKVVQDDKRIRELEQQIASLQQERQDLLILVHAHPKVIEKSVVQESRKNAISLIGGISQTKLEVSQTASTYNAKNKYEADLGLMYQRDFKRVRGSIAATLNGTALLGIGFTF
jgi:hypothetical protein